MRDAAHQAMWERLDLDIEAHDALLSVLGKFYGDIYLSQEGRLKGAEYLDFVLSEVHGLRIREIQEAKAAGQKVVGTFCVFVPEELTLAAGALQVGLCAGAKAGTEKAETILPRNTCDLIKSFVGFKLARLCPYTESCDLVVGETTCDGKKKAYETFGEYVDMHVLEVPQCKGPGDRDLFRSELVRYKQTLEKLTGKAITAASLAEATAVVNAKRRALTRLAALRAADPAPISGRDALLVNQISFYDDPLRFTLKINELCDEIEARIASGQGVAPAGTPRLLLAGCPMAVPNWKLPYLIESSGAVIVGEESCIGERNTPRPDRRGPDRRRRLARRPDRPVHEDRLRLFHPQHRAAGAHRGHGQAAACRRRGPLRPAFLPALRPRGRQGGPGHGRRRRAVSGHRDRLRPGGHGPTQDPGGSLRGDLAVRELAGLDIGSRSIELVVRRDGATTTTRRLPTTFDPLGQLRALFPDGAPRELAVTG